MKDERLHNALMDSLDLSTSGHDQEALRLMDEVIAEAIREGDYSSFDVLIHHASRLNPSHVRDRSILKHYYEEYLTYSLKIPGRCTDWLTLRWKTVKLRLQNSMREDAIRRFCGVKTPKQSRPCSTWSLSGGQSLLSRS